MKKSTNLCPVAGWSISPIKALDSIAIKLDFLPRSTSVLGRPNQFPKYVLTVEQATELAETITRTLQNVKLPEGDAKQDAAC